VGEWYYIGHYGQLGPLTSEQMDELVQGGVIARETFVWRTGMTDWIRADQCNEIRGFFRSASPSEPPPPPTLQRAPNTAAPYASAPSPSGESYLAPNYPRFTPIKSDRSRTAAGVLQLLIPGVGRMYSGYAAIGVLQLLLSPCMIGWVWSLVDGIFILSGGVKLDGYGRQMGD
jgi:hypothetical protein